MAMIESACVDFDRPTSRGAAPKTKIGRTKVNGQQSKRQKGKKRDDGVKRDEDGSATSNVNIHEQKITASTGSKINHLLEADFQLRNKNKLQRQLELASKRYIAECDSEQINISDKNVPLTLGDREHDDRIAAAEAMSTLASGFMFGTSNSDSKSAADYNDNHSTTSSKDSSDNLDHLIIDTGKGRGKKRQKLRTPRQRKQGMSEDVQEDIVTSSSSKRTQKNAKKSPEITSLLQTSGPNLQYVSNVPVCHAGVPPNVMPVQLYSSNTHVPAYQQTSFHPSIQIDNSGNNTPSIPLCVSNINQTIVTGRQVPPKRNGKGKRQNLSDQAPPLVHGTTFPNFAQYGQPNVHTTGIVTQDVILNAHGDYVPPSKVSRTVETQTGVESAQTRSSENGKHSMPDIQMLTLGSSPAASVASAIQNSVVGPTQAINSGYQYVPVVPMSAEHVQPTGPMVVHGGKQCIVVEGPAQLDSTDSLSLPHMCLPIVIDNPTSVPPLHAQCASAPNPVNFHTKYMQQHAVQIQHNRERIVAEDSQSETRTKPQKSKVKKTVNEEKQYKPPLPLSILNLPPNELTVAKPTSAVFGSQPPMNPVTDNVNGNKKLTNLDQAMQFAQKQALQRLGDNLARASGKERAFMLGQIQAILTMQKVVTAQSNLPSPLGTGSNILLRAQLQQSGDPQRLMVGSPASKTGSTSFDYAPSGGGNSENTNIARVRQAFNGTGNHDSNTEHDNSNINATALHVQPHTLPPHRPDEHVRSNSPNNLQPLGQLTSLDQTPSIGMPTGIPTVVQNVSADRSHLKSPSGRSQQDSPSKGSSPHNSHADNVDIQGDSDLRERKHPHSLHEDFLSSSEGSHLPFKKRRMAKFKKAAERAAEARTCPNQPNPSGTAAGDGESSEGGGYQNSQIDPHVSLLCLSEIQTALRQDEDGDVPLHIAVVHENIAAVRKFVDLMKLASKSVDVYNNDKQTPLHLAIITNQPRVVELLLAAGANVNCQNHIGHSAIHMAAHKGYANCLSILIKKCQSVAQLDKKDFEGFSPLHLAVHQGHENVVTELLHFGADANVQDGKSGRTPLFHAAETNQRAIADILLRSQAKVNIMNYAGNTAVISASGRSNTDIVTLLMQFGADTKGTNIGDTFTRGPPVRDTTNLALKQAMRSTSPSHLTPTSPTASPGASQQTRKPRGRPKRSPAIEEEIGDGS